MEEEIEIDPETEDLAEVSPDKKSDTGPKIITNFEILRRKYSPINKKCESKNRL